MPYLRFHPASEVFALERSPRLSGERFRHQTLQLGPSPVTMTGPARDTVGGVERAMDLVERRLDNLRALVAQFGLDEDDGPKAA